MDEIKLELALKKDIIRFTFDVNELSSENNILEKLEALDAPKSLFNDLSQAIVNIYQFCKK